VFRHLPAVKRLVIASCTNLTSEIAFSIAEMKTLTYLNCSTKVLQKDSLEAFMLKKCLSQCEIEVYDPDSLEETFLVELDGCVARGCRRQRHGDQGEDEEDQGTENNDNSTDGEDEEKEEEEGGNNTDAAESNQDNSDDEDEISNNSDEDNNNNNNTDASEESESDDEESVESFQFPNSDDEEVTD
jgi:hypothetical protein